MTVAYFLRRLGACREAIDWAEAQVGKTDLEIWRACDNPHWLAWIVERSRVHILLTLIDALRPIWWARKVAIHAAFEACYGEGGWPDPYSDEHIEELQAQYIEACTRADQNAASMIRHTVAMPTREQLIAAAEYWRRYDEALPF